MAGTGEPGTSGHRARHVVRFVEPYPDDQGGILSTTEPTPTPAPRTPRRTSIRSKLLAALALPVFVVALITGIQANQSQRELNDTRDQVELALAAGGPSTFVTALLDERNQTALDLLDLGDIPLNEDIASVAEARERTDEAQAQFEDSIASKNAEVREMFAPAQKKANEILQQVRERTDTDGGEPGGTNDKVVPIYDDYSEVIETLIDANYDAVGRIDDAHLHSVARAIAENTNASNLASLMLREVVLPTVTPTEPDTFTASQLYAQNAMAEAQSKRSLSVAPEALEVAEAYFGRDSQKIFLAQIEQFVENGAIGDIEATIEAAAEPSGTSYPESLEAALNARGDALIGDAQRTRNLYLAVFFLATGLSVLFALIIAQSISRPLVSIAEQADEMATTRLPEAVRGVLATPIGEDVVEPTLEPITVRSTDETALVAASINDVQHRALNLAVEQAAQRRNFADTFLNLGRRVQGLVNRQLEFITDLEDAEEDAGTLADLFKLDHLATRIRRNAESLVVLAGVTRRTQRGEPAPVVEAMRSALGEVDDYTRVAIEDVAHTRLPMSVAADLSHILAELIENGLNFSPPDTDVTVTGRRTTDGYRITVADRGIGMDADQVATANRRLSGNESFTVAPSRYMGHYVAGHLATGLGIDVGVTSSPEGTVATVDIPERLLVPDSKTPDPGAVDGTPTDVDDEQPDPGPSPEDPTSEPDAAGAVPDGDVTSAEFVPQGPPRTESLSSLLAAHRRLSGRAAPPATDRSPWARAGDAAGPGAANDAGDADSRR